ncbi:hypothetical protein AYO40_01190 [Planctomycetaceae bacterium SCGC AG-212-D15]|nr:hypothetical protein AYO40_01190 [Planctomycetaceae bacterium SCGC AG-212-D15]
MINHSEVLRAHREYSDRRDSAKASVDGLEGTLAAMAERLSEQKKLLLRADGAVEALEAILAGSEGESARVSGILRGLKRGVLTWDDVDVEDDIVVNIKETAQV